MSQTTQQTTAEIVTVEVHGIAVGGAAVGRVVAPTHVPQAPGNSRVGMTAFVPFAAPGDRVRVRVTKAQPRHLEGEIVEILTPSPNAATPACPYFEECGGCDLQHMEYEAQLRAKSEMIAGAFRAGGLPTVADKIQPIVPGPPYSYRRRVTLHVDGDGRLGYFRRRTHTVLPVTTCPISLPEIDQFLATGTDFSGLMSADLSGPMAMTLHLEAGENGLFAVLKADRFPVRMSAEKLLQRLKPYCTGGAVEVAGKTIALFGESNLLRRLAGISAADDGSRALGHDGNVGEGVPGEFSQVNAAINAQLVDRIRAIAQASGAKNAFDLYAGAGNFSLPLAVDGISVTAVEEVAALVNVGRAEADRLGLIDRLIFVSGTVEKFLRKVRLPVELILADPPRAGLKEVAIVMPPTAHFLLVSCHLPSAVRDVRNLVGEGWVVDTVYPFDMFAQTAQVELLTYLRRL